MVQVFTLFLLFILPFIMNPFGGAFFEPPKVILAEVVIEMLMVYFLLRHKLSRQLAFLLPIGLLFALSLIGLIFHPSAGVLFGNQFRLQGTFLFWHLLIFTLISRQFELKIPKFLLYLLLPALLLATLLLGTDSNGRSVGSLGEANALAAAAVFFWPFAWFQSRTFWNQNEKIKWLLKGLGLILSLVIIFLSASRSGLVALLIQIIFLLVLKLSKNLKLALNLTILLFLASLLLPFWQNSSSFKFEDRSEVWKVAYFAGWQSPIFGQGFGNLENAFKFSAQKINSDLQYQYVDSAHNILLDFWVEGGVIGLGVLVFLLISTIRNFWQTKKIREIILILGLLTVLSFNPASVVSLLAFWWLIGQGFKALDYGATTRQRPL